MMTMSCPSGSLDLFNRKNSLNRRFILFRLTAVPTFFPAVMPSLLMPAGFLWMIHVKCSE